MSESEKDIQQRQKLQRRIAELEQEIAPLQREKTRLERQLRAMNRTVWAFPYDPDMKPYYDSDDERL